MGTFVRNAVEGLESKGWTVRKTAVAQTDREGLPGKIERHLRLLFGLIRAPFMPHGIMYVHSPTWFSPLVLIVAKIRGFPIAVNIHGSEIHGRNKFADIFWPITRMLIRTADVVISPSRYFTSVIEESVGPLEERLFVSPSGGIDRSLFRPGADRDAFRRELGFSPNEIVLGYVSRIVPGKGWRFFLDVVVEARRRDRRVRAVMAGVGKESAALEAEIVSRQLAGIVLYVGGMDQESVARYHSAMDVFLFTSQIKSTDTLGLAPIEAISSGVPTVAFDSNLTREYINEGNGELVPLGDVGAFADAAIRLSQAVRQDARAPALISATVERFSSGAVADALSRRFDTLIGGPEGTV